MRPRERDDSRDQRRRADAEERGAGDAHRRRGAVLFVARVELRVYITDQDDPGMEVFVPDVRIENSRMIDDEIKEARIEIRRVRFSAQKSGRS